MNVLSVRNKAYSIISSSKTNKSKINLERKSIGPQNKFFTKMGPQNKFFTKIGPSRFIRYDPFFRNAPF
ncbi:MAG: hypothetical protein DRR16_11485 [Candidatus Parabeggiatoa sp. nov. 3]|nr:MAG: hypothetical protein DRQ99_07075 [Gammaproteobacteria bacterium]RKZ85692.1 MAG: hypothetical protein DRR16_11485 [Gammaproteobacteria bacterium]